MNAEARRGCTALGRLGRRQPWKYRIVVATTHEAIRVEFYGLARHRAETSSISIAIGRSMTLASLWQVLTQRFPRLAEANCEQLPQAMYRVNLDGRQFVTDPRTPIDCGQCVLVMSADVGG